MLDGSTDITTTEQEIVHLRLLKDGEPVNIFLGLMAVKDGSAKGIATELNSFLTDLGIQNWKAKLIGLGTDGASVNIGHQGGLGALLKQEIPYLLQVHCIAHRLELAVHDACKNIDFVGSFQETLKGLLKFYACSSKRLGELSDAGVALNSILRAFGS